MNLLDPVEVVARTLWGEARGEGLRGMQAVANVIANRVANPRWWGKDWISVCRKAYQFSCWNETDPNRQLLLNVDETDKRFAIAMRIARNAIDGRLPDLTKGSDHYYARSMRKPPTWAAGRDARARIGNHLFYRLR